MQVNTSALAFGGGAPADSDQKAITELWNGSAWTETADLNTARHHLGAGAGNVQLSALAFGGPRWRWSKQLKQNLGMDRLGQKQQILNTGREGMGSGTYTSALAYGGNVPPGALTESWNGSAWTEVNDLNTGRQGMVREVEEKVTRQP